MASIIAVCNRKGGVGKTTTLYHLARAAHLAGGRTLLIDLDPQGNLTKALSAEPIGDDSLSIADVLSPQVNEPLYNVIVPTIWENVDLAPAVAATLDVVEDQLVTNLDEHQRHVRLRDALVPVRARYNRGMIDNPPKVGHLTINGLVAADGALGMAEPDEFAADGLAALLDTIDQIRLTLNQQLRIWVLINKYQRVSLADRKWLAEIGDALTARTPPVPVLDPPMPLLARIRESRSAGLGLDEWPVDPSKSRYLAGVYGGYLTAMEGALAS